MVKFISSINKIKNEELYFKDEDIEISYHYFFLNKQPNELFKKYKGNILEWLQNYNKKPLKEKGIHLYESSIENKCYINYFNLHFNENDFIEYEFFIYYILQRLNVDLLNFPKVLTFYLSKNIEHIGFILNPILLKSYSYNNTNVSVLSSIFNAPSINISDIIAIILQISCCLEIAQQELNFVHYSCLVNNFLMYKLNGKKHKYLRFNIPNYGTIHIPAKYVLIFQNFKYSRINIKFFPKTIAKQVIQYWYDNETNDIKTSQYNQFFDCYTLINDVYKLIQKNKNLTGKVDKKTLFAVACRNMISEWKEYKTTGDVSKLSIKTPLDLIKFFNELGLTSLRLPSNKIVNIYNYGNNGNEKRTYLTYNKCKHTPTKLKKENINIENCTWKEIQKIAKEFGLKRGGKGINKKFLKEKIKELPFY